MKPETWRKSSYSSGGTSGECVELASLGGSVGVRDSKDLAAGHLSIAREDLASLVGRIKAGLLDL